MLNSNTFTLLHILIHFIFFFFNDTATTEIYTLSLHDALPISERQSKHRGGKESNQKIEHEALRRSIGAQRSEEHTSELQSQSNLVCRLLLEKKKTRYSSDSTSSIIRSSYDANSTTLALCAYGI